MYILPVVINVVKMDDFCSIYKRDIIRISYDILDKSGDPNVCAIPWKVIGNRINVTICKDTVIGL